jgi:predicted LPLAT superfamily acyltransferase
MSTAIQPIQTNEEFRLCAVIPNYNHPHNVGTIVHTLLAHGLPCIIVNDGSNQETKTALIALAETSPDIHLVHHEVNKGKGGAVKTGLFQAAEQGFTHALQIDADGQHNADDIPRMIQAAKRSPQSVILGRPVFDESIPKGRLYPRYITHFWVWVETLSFEIQDSMCGFRIYPLPTTTALLRRTRTGDRMDFDIEIIVRLYWANVPFDTVDTAVQYPEGGVSHFRLWQDNVLISWLHTRLSIGMLLRFPWLLLRRRNKPQRSDSPIHWSATKERGSLFGIKMMMFGYRVMGRRFARALLYPVIGYFYLTGRQARDASQTYLKQLYSTEKGKQALSHPPRKGDSFRHLMEFGRAALDKLSAWMGDIKRKDITWDNRERLLNHIDKREGAVLLGAHLGNIEVLRAIAEDTPGLKMNVIVFTKHAAQFNHILQSLNPNSQVELIHVESIGIDTGAMLKSRIDKGEMVAILGDRLAPGTEERSQNVSFLGQTARFPEGPFILAGLLDCPVYLLFCLRDKGWHYNIHLEPFADTLKCPRKQRKEKLREWIQAYATQLEEHCYKAPYQWFNFYDFWHQPDLLGSDGQDTNSEQS